MREAQQLDQETDSHPRSSRFSGIKVKCRPLPPQRAGDSVPADGLQRLLRLHLFPVAADLLLPPRILRPCHAEQRAANEKAHWSKNCSLRMGACTSAASILGHERPRRIRHGAHTAASTAAPVVNASTIPSWPKAAFTAGRSRAASDTRRARAVSFWNFEFIQEDGFVSFPADQQGSAVLAGVGQCWMKG